MVLCVNAGNGQSVGICAAEITSVPFYELIHQDLEKANREIQVAFSQILNGFSRQMGSNRTSVEFLWKSIATKAQTYEAQVRMIVIFRQLGSTQNVYEMENFCRTQLQYFQMWSMILGRFTGRHRTQIDICEMCMRKWLQSLSNTHI